MKFHSGGISYTQNKRYISIKKLLNDILMDNNMHLVQLDLVMDFLNFPQSLRQLFFDNKTES